MNIYLGDLSVEFIERRLGIDFPPEIREFMKANHQDEAEGIKPGKWHCFDIPFTLVCGDVDTATKIFNSVKARSSEVIEQLHIAIQKQQEVEA